MNNLIIYKKFIKYETFKTAVGSYGDIKKQEKAQKRYSFFAFSE